MDVFDRVHAEQLRVLSPAPSLHVRNAGPILRTILGDDVECRRKRRVGSDDLAKAAFGIPAEPAANGAADLDSLKGKIKRSHGANLRMRA